MKISINLDTDAPHAATTIVVDGKRVGRITKFLLDLDMEHGVLKVTRLVPGYGGKFLNKHEMRMHSAGGKWVFS